MDDVQSWWEVPGIAHFCSLFRKPFDLLDFDIEELEEGLLTDSAEDVGSSLIQDLVVRLLKGCSVFNKDDVTSFNYQMYLRRLFRIKCEEDPARNNPFNRDVAFHSLPLRTKVEIIHDLCDFRLESDDVQEHLKGIDPDSLRVGPLGEDSGGSTYWYFYGTRLYREDYSKRPSKIPAKKRYKKSLKGDELDLFGADHIVAKWQVVCYTEEDWQLLARKFKNCKAEQDINLDRALREDFLPVLPRLFAVKEKLMRKRMMDQQLRRSSRSILGRPNDDGSESPNAAASVSGEPETDDEVKRRRLLQEKADRLLAEAMQREERKAGLQLRERRGGGGGTSVSTSSNRGSSNANPETEDSADNSHSQSHRHGNPRRQTKQKRNEGKARMTNNSLSACLPFVLDVDSKAGSDEDDDDDDDVEGRNLQEDTDIDDVPSDEDENDDTFKPKSPSKRKKKQEKEGRKDKDKDKDKESKAKKSKAKENSTESSSSSKKKKTKIKKSKSKERKSKIDDEDSDVPKPKVSKVKDKESVKKESPEVKKTPLLPMIPTGGSGVSKTKVKSSVLFSQNEEDVNIGMHKVMEAIKNHRDAWPFASPVEENYAPNYYKVILFPMNLDTMEDKLDNHEYTTLEQFKADFASIVNNCVKYNGPTNEYTEMVHRLDIAFQKAIDRYIIPDESDEEISIEYNAASERKRPRLNSTVNQQTSPKTPKDIIEKRKEVVKSLSESVAKSQITTIDRHADKKSRKQLMRHHPRIDGLASVTAETLKDMDKWLEDSPHLKRPKPGCSSPSSTASSDSEVMPSRAPDPPKPPKKSSTKGRNRDRERERDRERDDDDDSKSRSRDSHSRDKDKEKKEKRKDPSYPIPSRLDSTKPVKKRARPEEFDKEKDAVQTPAPAPPTKHHHKHHRHSNSNGERDRPPNKGSGEHSRKKEKEKDRESSSGHHRGHSKKDIVAPLTSTQIAQSQKSQSNVHAKGHSAKRSNTLLMGFKGSGTNKRLQVGKATKFNRQSGNGGHGSSENGPDYSRHGHGGSKSENSGAGKGGSSTSDQTSASSSVGKDEKKKCLLVSDLPGDGKGPKLSLGTVLPKEAVKLGDFKKPDDEGSDDEDSATPTPTIPAHTNTVDELDLLDKLEKTFGPLIKEKAIALISEGAAAKAAKKSGGAVKVELTEEERTEQEATNQEEADRKLEPSKGFNRDKSLPNLAAWFKAFGGPSATTRPPSLPVTSPLKRLDDPKSRFKVMGRGIGEDSTGPRQSHKQFPRGLKQAEASSSSSWSQKEGVSLGNPPTPTQSTSSGGGGGEDIARELQQHKRNRNRKMSTSSLSSQSELGSPSFSAGQEDRGSGGVVVVPPRWVDTTTEHWGSQSQSPSSQVSSQSPAGPNSPFSPPISSPPQTPPRPPGPVRVGFYQDMSAASQNSSSPEKINEPLSVSNSNSNVASPATPPNMNPGTPNPNSREPKNYTTTGGGYVPPYAPRYGNSTPSPASQGHIPSPSGGPLSVGSPQGGVGSPHSPSISKPALTPSPGGLNLADYRGTPQMTPPPAFAHTHAHAHPLQQQMRPSNTPTGGRGSGTSAPSILSISSYPTSASGGPPPYPGSYMDNRIDGVGVVSNPIFSHSHHHGHPHGLSPHPEAAHAHSHHHSIQQSVSRYGLPGSAPAAHANSVPQAAHQHQSSAIPNLPSAGSVSTSGGIVYGGRSGINTPTSAAQAQPPSAYHSNPYTSNPRNINVAPSVYNNPAERFYTTGKSGEGLLGMVLQPNSIPLSSGGNPTTTTSSTSRGRNKAQHQQMLDHLNDHDRERDSHSGGSHGSHGSHGGGHGHRSSPMEAAGAAGAGSKGSGSELPTSAMNGFQWPHNLASLTQIVNNIPNPMAVGVSPYLNRGHPGHPHFDPSAQVENMGKYSRGPEQPSYTILNAGSGSGGGKSGRESGGHVTTNHGLTHQENLQLAKTLASLTGGGGGEGSTNEGSSSGASTGSGSGRRSSSKAEGKSRQGKAATAAQQQLMAASSFNFSALPSDLALYSKEMDPSGLYTASPPSLAHAHRGELYPTSTSSFHSTFAAASAAAARTTSGGVPTASIPPYQMPPFIGSHPSPYQPQPVSSQPSPFAHSQAPRAIVDSYQQFFQNSPHVMAGLLPPAGYAASFTHAHHGLGFTRPGWI